MSNLTPAPQDLLSHMKTSSVAADSMSKTQRRVALGSIVACLTIIGLGHSLLFTVLPPVGRSLGLTEVQIGSVVSLAAILGVLTGPFWGRMCDRVGRKKMLLFGMVGYVVTTLGMAVILRLGMDGVLGVSSMYISLIAVRMLYAMSSMPVIPAGQSFVALTTSAEDRTAGLALIGAAYGIGMITGPALGGTLASVHPLAPLYAAAGLAVVAMSVATVVLHEPAKPLQHRANKLRFRDPRISSFVVIAAAATTVVAAMQQTAGFVIQDRLGLDDVATIEMVGIALMASAIGSIGVQVLLVQRLKWPPGPLLRLGFPLWIVGFAVLGLGEGMTALVTGFTILGLGFGVLGPGYTAAGTLAVTPEEQGAVAGLTSAAGAMGYVIGPAGGAALYQLHPLLPFGVSGGLSVLLWLFVMSKKMPGKRVRATPT